MIVGEKFTLFGFGERQSDLGRFSILIWNGFLRWEINQAVWLERTASALPLIFAGPIKGETISLNRTPFLLPYWKQR